MSAETRFRQIGKSQRNGLIHAKSKDPDYSIHEDRIVDRASNQHRNYHAYALPAQDLI